MSAALVNELRQRSLELAKLTERVEEIEKVIALLEAEIERVKKAKRPDRPPIKVPKRPRILKSIGVGLEQE